MDILHMNIFNEEIVEYIDNYKTTINDKKERGSVFTKSHLIYKMIKLLPSQVWTNPNLKWLDPGCGIGNFMIIVFIKLMKYLPIENVEGRRKHIIENMLFFVELDENYIKILKQLFCSDKYNLNIFNGSFVYLHTLEENIQTFNHETFNIKFNIILGNPPYQKINMKDKTKLSAKPLYPFFVDVAIDNLDDLGYLLFIHPVSWRRKSKEIKIINNILKNRLLYIYTNNNFTEFDNSAPFINYYLLQKNPYNKRYLTQYETVFNDKVYTGKVHLKNDLEYLPVFLTKETMTILNKVIVKSGDKFDIEHEVKFTTQKKNISANKDNVFKYLNYHTLSKKNGDIYRYSNKLHPSSDKLKIILVFKGGYKYLNPFIDNGTMGITVDSMRLLVNDEEKDLLLEFFKSDLLKFLLMITTYNYGSNQKNELYIINTFTKPTTNEFYNFYDLNDHITFINDTLV